MQLIDYTIDFTFRFRKFRRRVIYHVLTSWLVRKIWINKTPKLVKDIAFNWPQNSSRFVILSNVIFSREVTIHINVCDELERTIRNGIRNRTAEQIHIYR